jgi:AcrR family transcriptional regulator
MPKVSQAHKDARRRQIIDAAIACFARRGLHATTMQDIIRRARLSAGAIYLQFKSKEEIVEAIAAKRHARERAAMAEAARVSDFSDALRGLGDAFFGRLDDPMEVTQRRIGVQVWAEALVNPRLMKIVRRGVDGPRAALRDLIGRAQRQGDLPADLDADATAAVLIATFQGLVLQLAWRRNVDVAAYVRGMEWLFTPLTGVVGSERPTTARTKPRAG